MLNILRFLHYKFNQKMWKFNLSGTFKFKFKTWEWLLQAKDRARKYDAFSSKILALEERRQPKLGC